jgi:hypothetical protein
MQSLWDVVVVICLAASCQVETIHSEARSEGQCIMVSQLIVAGHMRNVAGRVKSFRCVRRD